MAGNNIIFGSLSGNIAFCGMTNGGGAAFVGENTASGRGGEGRSAFAMQTATGFPVDFTRSPWTYEEGKLPGLFGGTVEMPEHLRSSIYITGTLDVTLDNTGSTTVYPMNYVDDTDACDKTFVFVVNGTDYEDWTFTCNDVGYHSVLIVTIDEN